jgi:hypothetical protein
MRDTRKTERIELETLRLVGKIEFIGPNKTGTYQFEWSQCLSRLESRVAYFSQDIRRDGAVGGFSWPAPNVGMAQVDKFLAESSGGIPSLSRHIQRRWHWGSLPLLVDQLREVDWQGRLEVRSPRRG